jgi:hypothetical protein
MDIALLKPHEKIRNFKLGKVAASLLRNKKLFYPIVVENSNFVILDGHHRLEAFKKLGFKKIPCLLLDYSSEKVSVFPRRKSIPISKEIIVQRALLGDLFPPKTTRHMLGKKFKINYALNFGGANMAKRIEKIKEKIERITSAEKSESLRKGRYLWQDRFAC